ncbi:hypothetical protein DH2020_047547 [Rehmannia glutinosa]|uniref:SAC domain-containing protein n=1 Tax=Rehmannia glutinosa TaxID=99300 RepID=A0ABR0U8K4_REHGL
MALENKQQARINVESTNYGGGGYLQKFRLYETRSYAAPPPLGACLTKNWLLTNFYMIGRDKNRTCWKVLKICRLEQSELSVIEDATTYSEIECYDLLKRIHEGNKSTGGLKFVTTCYGIVEGRLARFVVMPYIPLLKSEMIPILNSTLHSNMAYSKNENRSFANSDCNVKSQCYNERTEHKIEYACYVFVKLSISGFDINLILIARRSRHYAGTRYLKRVSKKDDKYEATKLHFENLVKRYGNPIIILNLIKTREKKPRESILRAEFANAIEVINKDLAHENRLKFLHWDLSKYSRNKAASVLAYLVKVAANALDLTGFFYCQVLPSSSQLPCSNNCYGDFADEDLCNVTKGVHNLNAKYSIKGGDVNGSHFVKPPVFQRGVLRTNCIDCLDRTNVAQYVYGLVALAMGDTLALQYGGSTAHNKFDLIPIRFVLPVLTFTLFVLAHLLYLQIFSETRGQWKAATQSQEFLRTLQRYYSNAYMDAEKQDAINVFLGHFQPQQGKPALWELDSDQHYDVRRRGSDFAEENASAVSENSLNVVIQMDNSHRPLPGKIQGCNVGLSESTPEISTCETDISYSRYFSNLELFILKHYLDNDSVYFVERGDSFNCSNFLDVDWLSSSGNSCEEETYERSLLIGSPSAGLSSGKELASGDLSDGAACSSNDLAGFSQGRALG